jgi:hypothetical protein
MGLNLHSPVHLHGIVLNEALGQFYLSPGLQFILVKWTEERKVKLLMWRKKDAYDEYLVRDPSLSGCQQCFRDRNVAV